jgi:DNA primase large subunit
MPKEVDQNGERVKKYACAASNTKVTTRRSTTSKIQMKKLERKKQNGHIRKSIATQSFEANGKANEECRKIRRVEKGKQTYLKISSQVLDDADQQLGLTSREGRVRGVRHDCLFLLTMCLMWLVFDGKNIFVDQRDLMW